MALTHSTGLRNALLNSGIATLFDTNGRLAIISGTQPARDAILIDGGHILLATLTLSADAMGTASAAAISFNAITQDSDVDASGTPGFFCIYLSTETALTSIASATDKRLTGTVTLTAGGGDITYDSVSWALHGIATLSTLSYTAPV
jgi:hypothetical protein